MQNTSNSASQETPNFTSQNPTTTAMKRKTETDSPGTSERPSKRSKIQPRTGLFDMLPEMRLNIFKYLTPPLHSHVSEVCGLLLACKTTYNEFAHEVRMAMDFRYLLNGIEKDWNQTYGTELRITMSLDILKNNNLTVSIPASFFRRSRDDCLPFPRPFIPLVSLRLSCLTFDMYEDVPSEAGIPIEDTWQLRRFTNCLEDLLWQKPYIDINEGERTFLEDRLQCDSLVWKWGNRLTLEEAENVALFRRTTVGLFNMLEILDMQSSDPFMSDWDTLMPVGLEFTRTVDRDKGYDQGVVADDPDA